MCGIFSTVLSYPTEIMGAQISEVRGGPCFLQPPLVTTTVAVDVKAALLALEHLALAQLCPIVRAYL